MTHNTNDTIDRFAELTEQLLKLSTMAEQLTNMADSLELSDRDKLDLAAITKRMAKRIRKQMINLVEE